MDTAQQAHFSTEGLAVLNRQMFDPTARGRYEYLSGGLMWSDEFPRPGTVEWEAIALNYAYRFLLACRAAITLGEERAPFCPVWLQVIGGAPHWPGLRAERRGERARRRLQAALRQRDKCLAECDSQPGC